MKIEHTPGPWEYEQGLELIRSVPLDIADVLAPDVPANGALLALAPTAPHDCADPACPGNVNRRKLAAFEAMRLRLRWITNVAAKDSRIYALAMEALTLAAEAEG